MLEVTLDTSTNRMMMHMYPSGTGLPLGVDLTIQSIAGRNKNTIRTNDPIAIAKVIKPFKAPWLRTFSITVIIKEKLRPTKSATIVVESTKRPTSEFRILRWSRRQTITANEVYDWCAAINSMSAVPCVLLNLDKPNAVNEPSIAGITIDKIPPIKDCLPDLLTTLKSILTPIRNTKSVYPNPASKPTISCDAVANTPSLKLSNDSKLPLHDDPSIKPVCGEAPTKEAEKRQAKSSSHSKPQLKILLLYTFNDLHLS